MSGSPSDPERPTRQERSVEWLPSDFHLDFLHLESLQSARDGGVPDTYDSSVAPRPATRGRKWRGIRGHSSSKAESGDSTSKTESMGPKKDFVTPRTQDLKRSPLRIPFFLTQGREDRRVVYDTSPVLYPSHWTLPGSGRPDSRANLLWLLFLVEHVCECGCTWVCAGVSEKGSCREVRTDGSISSVPRQLGSSFIAKTLKTTSLQKHFRGLRRTFPRVRLHRQRASPSVPTPGASEGPDLPRPPPLGVPRPEPQ